MNSVRFARLRNRRLSGRFSGLLLGTLMSATLLTPMPAAAQDDSAARIRKLEGEVKALQRKVFPGADGKYFEAEIVPQQSATPAPAPSTGAVTDLLTRMDAVESAIASLTAQTEVNQNALRVMSARIDTLEAKARQLDAIPVEPDGGIGSTPAPATAVPLRPTPAVVTKPAATPAPALSQGKPAPAPAPAAPAKLTVADIEKPSTGDKGEDAYSYGYRLWDAKFYAAAQKQLAATVKEFPNHSKASYAQNLLGRAYLDDNKPRPAAEAFLKNYLDNRGGARAPDSLVYLAIATMQLGNKAKACEALEEFRLVYPNEASGRLATLSADTAKKAGCK